MKKFQIFIVVILVVLIGTLAWWYRYSSSEKFSSDKEPIKIGMVSWIGNGIFYVAEEKGLFKKEGVRVEFVPVDDFAAARQLLQTGRVDAIYLTPETAAVLSDSGVKLRIVAAGDVSYGADGMIATKDITTIEDLKGKNVAFETGSASHLLISYLLNEKGLSTNDVQVVESVAPDAGAAFVAGKVDAAVTWEPWLSKANERAGGHVLASSKDTPIIYDMPIFRAEVVDNRSDEVSAMLRATFEVQQWIADNKDEAADIIAKPLKITPAEALDQMQGVRWLSYEENVEKITSGNFSIKNSLQTAGDLWLKLGLIKSKVNADELIDDTILKNLYK